MFRANPACDFVKKHLTCSPMATILNVATSFPETTFSQEEMSVLLGATNPVVQKLLKAPHIKQRHLFFPGDVDRSSRLPKETPAQLHKRFVAGVETIGLDAAKKVTAGVDLNTIGFVVAVTSSGLLLPGLSAIIVKELGLPRNVNRLDVVGMGCNAGMSSLRTLTMMMAGYPNGKKGLLLCCEINSALYVNDDTPSTGIVNSLFGDGAVAILVDSVPKPLLLELPKKVDDPIIPRTFWSDDFGASAKDTTGPTESKVLRSFPALGLIDFESATLPEYFEDMMYVVDEQEQQMNFKLSKRIPFAVGDNVATPVVELLSRHALAPTDVSHWIVHTGGAAVIEGICKNLGLSMTHLRHTTSVLHDCGNISSGSFLASFERLVQEDQQSHVISKGDIAVLIAMGPGTTIEVGLGVF